MTLAALLRTARQGVGLSQAALSRRCSELDGRPARSWAVTIARIERGLAEHTEYPTLVTLAAACGGIVWFLRTDEGMARWDGQDPAPLPDRPA